MTLSTIKQVRHIQAVMLSAAASGAAYEKWGADYALKKVREVWTNVDDIKGGRYLPYEFTIADFKKLTADELISVGFARWTNNHFVIPLYLVNYIRRGEMVLDISDETETIDSMDLDTRAGCIAAGFILD